MPGKLKVTDEIEMRKRQNESENDQTGWSHLKIQKQKKNNNLKSRGEAIVNKM